MRLAVKVALNPNTINQSIVDDNMKVTQKSKSDWERVENIVRKGENAGIQHFLLFPQCFQKLFLQGR